VPEVDDAPVEINDYRHTGEGMKEQRQVVGIGVQNLPADLLSPFSQAGEVAAECRLESFIGVGGEKRNEWPGILKFSISPRYR
jgi:hypothetical protein